MADPDFNTLLVSYFRRNMPKLMAYDLQDVQPMSGPMGLVKVMDDWNRRIGRPTAELQKQGFVRQQAPLPKNMWIKKTKTETVVLYRDDL